MQKRSVSRTRQHGFTLVEMLVAVVVLSLGVLGTVGMQLSALQGNRDAGQQSAAVRLGAELAELMRDNKEIAQKLTPVENPYLVTFSGTLPNTTADCFVSCTDQYQVAQWGIREWLIRIKDELPEAQVVICYDAAPFESDGLARWECSNSGGVVMVKIGWTRRSTNSSQTGENAFETATRPSLVLPVTAGAGI